MSRCNVSNDLSKNAKGNKLKNSEKKINSIFCENKIITTKKNTSRLKQFLVREQELFIEGYSRENYNAIIPEEILVLFYNFIGTHVKNIVLFKYQIFFKEASKSLLTKSISEKKYLLRALKKYVDQGLILRFGFRSKDKSCCRRVSDLPYMKSKYSGRSSNMVLNLNFKKNKYSPSFCSHYKFYNEIDKIDDTKATYTNTENNKKDPYSHFNEVTLYHECNFYFDYFQIAA